MKKHVAYSDLIFFLTILVSIGTLLALFSSFSKPSFNCFFNADTLYLPSVYKDLFIDKNTLIGWHFSPAPYFFPDMFLYFLIMAVTSNFIITSFVYAFLQYFLLIYLVYRLLKAIELPYAKTVAALSNLLLLLFFMVSFFSNDFGFSFYLISNAYHSGAFLMSLLASILTIGYLKKSHASSLFYLSVIILFSVFSDRLFIVLYNIPWLLFLPFYLKMENKKGLIKVSMINIMSAAAGLIAFKIVGNSNYIYFGEPHRMMDYNFFGESFQLLLSQMYQYLIAWNFISLIIIVSLITFLFNLVLSIKKLLDPNKLAMKDVYHILSSIFTIVVFLAPVLNGSYTGYDTLRYNISVFYLLIINSGVLIHFLFHKLYSQSEKAINGLILILIIGASVNIFYQFNFNGLRNYFAYYPKEVESIDQIATNEKLNCGLGNYWSAKVVTLFSRKGIRIYPANNITEPYFHIMNEERLKEDKFNFILSDDLENEKVALNKLFGSFRIVTQEKVQLLITPEFTFNKESNQIKITN